MAIPLAYFYFVPTEKSGQEKYVMTNPDCSKG